MTVPDPTASERREPPATMLEPCSFDDTSGRTPPDDTTPDGCPHCDPTHRDPRARPWGVDVGPERDGDGQTTTLHVMKSDGAHVAESDAEWLWNLINEHGGMPGGPEVSEPARTAQRSHRRLGRGA